MWLASAAVGGALPVAVACVIGGALCATDPVLASDVVTGRLAERSTSPRWRDLLLAESAANDGLAYPLVMIPLAVVNGAHGSAAVSAALRIFFVDVVAGVAFGVAVGAAVAFVLHRLQRSGMLETEGHFALTLALAGTAALFAHAMHLDGIVAAFAAGAAFNCGAGRVMQEPRVRVHSAVDRFFTPAIFIVFGANLPWRDWAAHPVAFVVVALVAVGVRRLPLLAFCRFVPRLRTKHEVALYSFFGPMGAAAVLYALVAVKEAGLTQVWPWISAAVLASIAIHGFSATPLMRRFGRASP